MATGIVVLNNAVRQRAGSILMTEEITHNLGPGSVFIEFGIENKIPITGDASNRTEYLLGDVSVFASKDDSAAFAFDRGVRIYPEKGTFELAVRLRDNLQHPLRLRWFAWMLESTQKPSEQGKLIRLEPDVVRIGVGESVLFTPVFANGASALCDFFVEGRRSGSITREGKYIAPEHAGLFLISAQVRGEPKERANAFVIVEERKDSTEERKNGA